ncbi:MAG: prepilin-type N-terminal cleavage/methylation domain-containing protein [Nitrososphaerota archaeon]
MNRKFQLRGIEKGFTLIEILIAIAIMAILASIALSQHMNQQKRAKVSSYAEPMARVCLMDLAAYCVENPNTSLSINSTFGKNCLPSITTPAGNVMISGIAPSCNADGSLIDGSVTAVLATITDYTATCTIIENGFKCTVE